MMQKIDKIMKVFPELRDPRTEKQIEQYVNLANVDSGEFVCFEGDTCGSLSLVLDGRVRVYKIGESGREVTLYRLEAGDSCILTASCILSKKEFPAFAVVEKPVEAAIIPSNLFRDWVNSNSVWRDYVFSLFANRLADIIATVEEVAFRKMDARIAEYLLEKSSADDGEVRTTHQKIASDLGTSREVVSRILKDFEHEGALELSRGSISVINPGRFEISKNS